MSIKSKTACLFGGQGSQYIGMGKEYYVLDEDCRDIFKIASDVMGYDMAEFCFYGEEEKLQQTLFSLPSMLTIDLCAYTVAVKQGYTFQALAGFSLGEYAALAAAEVISIADAFELVKAVVLSSDSILTDDAYSMLVVTLPPEICDNICLRINNGFVRVANYNSKNQVTIAGNIEGIETFKAIASEFEGKLFPIHVNRPFHSEIMKPAADIISKEVERFKFNDPTIPIYMNATGEKTKNADEIKSSVIKHLNFPVLWVKTLENMQSDNIEQYVECGINGVLCRMVRNTLRVDREKTISFRIN